MAEGNAEDSPKGAVHNPVLEVPSQSLQLAKARQRVELLKGTELSLKNLRLQSLEDIQLQALPQLTVLNLSGNCFTFEGQLAPLKCLKELDLSHCNLSCLPRLPRFLATLRAGWNQLRTPCNVASSPQLQELFLDHNRLGSTEQLEMLLDLRLLDLSGNCLTSPQRSLRPLAACAKLQELQLRENPLAKEGKHRAMVASMFPSLVLLDGTALRHHKPPASPAAKPPAADRRRRDERTEREPASYLRPTVCSKQWRSHKFIPPDTRDSQDLAVVEAAAREAQAPQRNSQKEPRPRARSQPTRPNFQPRRDRHAVSALAQPVERKVRWASEPPELPEPEPAEPSEPAEEDELAGAEHLTLCRNLIEEKRRLLQRISAKLGEGVAKTALAPAPPSLGTVSQDIRSICMDLQGDIQRRKAFLAQSL
ncbi:unnamed protein product [Effrenium voratum]|uniref:Leucine-rich repeat-containing protein 46 n=1 Tax=Effrenium voratum TaxID=2562239 RepID=A0AA36JE36_9DINO|nr:unnamed protein product [Effrenium voratum]CAJ1431560.1 unnamed protein product [Effrenium voratum]